LLKLLQDIIYIKAISKPRSSNNNFVTFPQSTKSTLS